VFLADGQVVGTLDHPTPQAVLDRMRALGEPEGASSAPGGLAGKHSEPDRAGSGGVSRNGG
jgi:hypothetical protein